MSTNSYTTNPLTGRTIRVGGPTFNQLVMEAYDYIDGGLVRRVTAPSLPVERSSYLNVETGRMIQWGTRTYFHLIRDAGYDIIEDYYLVPPRFATVAQRDPTMLYWQDNQFRLENLNRALEGYHRELELEVFREVFEERHRQRQHDVQLRRLTELNIALCKECQMPVNLNELPENGLCEDCSKEI